MNKNKLLIIAALLFLPTLIQADPPIIIIPGTWAANSTWHQPGGDFFDTLTKASHNKCSKNHTFIWSGKNNHHHRVSAAVSLADVIEKFKEVIIIAHSHGCNVGNLASQELAKRKSKAKIKIFYALGNPVNTDEYAPDMSIVDYFYNLFSFGDVIQPVFGAFERVYPNHDRIANVAITVNGKDPSHFGLHDVVVAHWLPMLHDHLTLNLSFPFNFTHPCIVHFTHEHPPRYELDHNRSDALEQDKKFQRDFARAFDRGPRKYLQDDDDNAEQ